MQAVYSPSFNKNLFALCNGFSVGGIWSSNRKSYVGLGTGQREVWPQRVRRNSLREHQEQEIEQEVIMKMLWKPARNLIYCRGLKSDILAGLKAVGMLERQNTFAFVFLIF